MPAPIRSATSWHLILADLALIVFLVTAAALENDDDAASTVRADIAPPIEASQALYRAGPGLVPLAQWLDQQPRDPRAALTIMAQHVPGDENRIWTEARAMEQVATAQGVRVRVIIRPAAQSDLYASLAFDQPE